MIFQLTNADLKKLTPVSTNRNPFGKECYHYDLEEVIVSADVFFSWNSSSHWTEHKHHQSRVQGVWETATSEEKPWSTPSTWWVVFSLISNFSAKSFQINPDNGQPHGQSSTQSSSSSSFKKTIQKCAYKGASNNRTTLIPPARRSPDVVEIIDDPPRRKRSSAGETFLGFIDLTSD